MSTETVECSSTVEYIHTYVHIMLHIDKKAKLQVNPSVWMSLTHIMLSKRSHTQKSTYCVISFI